VSFPWQHGHTIMKELAIAPTLAAALTGVNPIY
jgi:hypothetical protein